ncbi:hypothetical protein Taro_042991, partial [Colocasia esculenta]|nr:hypothetical protein [Colocasia esculenta]
GKRGAAAACGRRERERAEGGFVGLFLLQSPPSFHPGGLPHRFSSDSLGFSLLPAPPAEQVSVLGAMEPNNASEVSVSSTTGEYPETTVEIKIKTLDSQTYSLRVNRSMPVPALKEQIANVTGILSEQQRLICQGKVLKDDQLLSAYRILLSVVFLYFLILGKLELCLKL